MKKLILTLLMIGLVATTAFAAVKSGKAAPDFSLVDTKGVTHTLSDYQGKNVILEWYNPDCPYVKKHYQSDNMQNLQKKYGAEGAVWFSINSSAVGKQGHYTPDEYNQIKANSGAAPTAVLLDHDGKVGKMYGAKTTPHIFIINSEGTLVYQGAIDSDSNYSPSVIPSSENYIDTTFSALSAGAQPNGYNKPYGCSVKY